MTPTQHRKHPAAQMPHGGADARQKIRVKRITMPRYEVEFPNIQDAHTVATTLKKHRTCALECLIKEQAGTEVVLDMSVSGLAFNVSLLFRVIQVTGQQTIIEWWPRRQTDPALLDLWLETLNAQDHAAEAPTKTPGQQTKPRQPTTASVRELFDLCRRALSKNPFTALAIHWSSDLKEIEAAHSKLSTSLQRFSKSKGLSPKAYQLIQLAQQQTRRCFKELSTTEGRVAARRRFVPSNQLAHAKELLDSKLQVALLRGDEDELYNLRRKLAELGA